MSTALDIAQLIPRKYRDHIVAENLIYKAIGRQGDTHMKQLCIIWSQYVEPGYEIDDSCPVCLNRILENYRALESHIVELCKADKLLDL